MGSVFTIINFLTFLLGIGLSGLTFATDDPFKDLTMIEKKAYVKGIKDAFKFLNMQSKTEIPKPGYWVVKDVSKYTLAQITVFAIYIQQKGYKPALLLNKATGQIYLVAGPFNKRDAFLVQKKLYPLKTFITEVKNTQLFQKAVVNSHEVVKCKQIEVSLEGVIQLLEATKSLLNEIQSEIINKKQATKDLERIIKELQKVQKNFIETQKYLENLE